VATTRSNNRRRSLRLRLADRARDDRGVALVEFAIILPAFLLILLGVMDFGKVFNYWQSATQAASTGARAGAVDHWPGTCTAGDPPVRTTPCTLQAWVRSQLKTRELYDDAHVCVRFPDTGGATSATAPGNRIQVLVRVPYAIPLVNAFAHGAAVQLNSSATMRIEVDSAATLGTPVAIDPAQNIPSGETCS
jgi:Flp pilus assembly protein TadG